MNNINLYLDNLVDQSYDITLIKYYFEWFYYCELKHDNNNGYRYGFGNGFGYGSGYGDGFIYEYVLENGHGHGFN